MPPTKKAALVVEVPVSVRDEVEQVARVTQRSVAFVVRRALAATTAGAPLPPAAAPLCALTLKTDEDDPADTLSKIKAAAGKRPLEEAVRTAWAATRERFLVLVRKQAELDQGERADELDTSLRDSQHPDTPVEQLTALSQSVYPRVRANVAGHARCPREVLERLAQDREPVVRDAAETRLGR